MRSTPLAPLLAAFAVSLSCRSAPEAAAGSAGARAAHLGPPSGSPAVEAMEVPGFRMVYLEHAGPYEALEEAFVQIDDYLARRDIEIAGPLVGIFHDDPTQAALERCVAEIGATVTGSPLLDPPFQVKDVSPGLSAVTCVRGGRDSVRSARALLREWIEEHGYRASGPVVELYVIEPNDEAGGAGVETQVIVPIRK
jgi:effector-binding domain-containing protein